jgi:hypothetical protein
LILLRTVSSTNWSDPGPLISQHPHAIMTRPV